MLLNEVENLHYSQIPYSKLFNQHMYVIATFTYFK